MGLGSSSQNSFLSKADVIRTVHERVQLCKDPQTARLRKKSGVSRINHILRENGHTILEEQNAAAFHDEIGQRFLDRLFRGLTEDSMTEATRPSAQASLELGSKERETSLLLHIWELSSQPIRTSRV